MWTRQPANFPKCPKECLYNTAPFTPDYIHSRYWKRELKAACCSHCYKQNKLELNSIAFPHWFCY